MLALAFADIWRVSKHEEEAVLRTLGAKRADSELLQRAEGV